MLVLRFTLSSVLSAHMHNVSQYNAKNEFLRVLSTSLGKGEENGKTLDRWTANKARVKHGVGGKVKITLASPGSILRLCLCNTAHA